MTKRITPRGAVRIYDRAERFGYDLYELAWSGCMGELLNYLGPRFFNPWSSLSKEDRELEIENIDRAIDRLTQIRDGLAQSIGE